ncbi:AMP-binding enzyme [Streptomyces coelicoflavus]|uniref:AMP-binding enzyme n=1 Tax=Streptomyces coelicoflavus TaxID=285562 RepID=UPI002E258FDF
MAAHRRHRVPRRRGLLDHHRPDQGHDRRGRRPRLHHRAGGSPQLPPPRAAKRRFGVRDTDRTEQVYAAVVRAPGSEVGADELRALVRVRRGAMYEPAHITFVEQLPLTDADKPDKKLLRSRAAQTPEANKKGA